MFRVALTLILLGGQALAADNLTDLRGWPANGFPAAAEWSGGHDFGWNVGHVRDGRRLLPTLRIPGLNQLAAPKQIELLNAQSADLKFLSDNRLPLILRHPGNISMGMAEDRGTPPTISRDEDGNVVATFNGHTACEWRLTPADKTLPDGTVIPAGTLDSRPLCDCFGPYSLWADSGKALGSSPWTARLQVLCPDPAFVGFWDNNEGGYPSPKEYSSGKFWKSRKELEGLSLRMQQYVNATGYDSDAYAFWPTFYTMRQRQYAALFEAFHESAWPGTRLITNAYSAPALAGTLPPQSVLDQIGYAPEALCYDGAGASLYPGENSPPSLLDPALSKRLAANIPAWEWSKAKNPNAFRTIFVSLGSGKAALGGVTAGVHEPITPDLFRGWCEWMAWQSRPKNGGAVLIQHWIGNKVKPGDLFFDETQRAAYPDLAALTHGDYSIAPALAADSICADGRREFWQRGTSVPVTVDNDKVRAVAVQLGDRALIYTWTPCDLSGLGDLTLTVDGTAHVTPRMTASSRYLLIGDTPEPVPVPVPDPQPNPKPEPPPTPKPPPSGTVTIDRATLQALIDALQKLLDGTPTPVEPPKPEPVKPSPKPHKRAGAGSWHGHQAS